MKQYKKNIEFLRHNSPVLYTQVTAAEPVFDSQTTLLPDISNALIRRGKTECYISSLYNRDREIASMFDGTSADARVIILFGLGTGEVLIHIRKHFNRLERLIIIEPNLDLFNHFLESNDLVDTLSIFSKVSLIVNQSLNEAKHTINDLINTERYQSMEFVSSISYRTLYYEYYADLYQTVLELIRAIIVNVTTRHHLTFRWLVNAWRNERQKSIDVEYLLDRLPPLPVIIVSAGPSLNNNIHLLAEAQNKAIIIAVGSAMTILESHGVRPHFRMAIDGHERNTKIFSAIDTESSPLIYTCGLYHEVLPAYKGTVIRMVLDSDYVARYIRKKSRRKTTLIRSAYSVANVALEFACKWGCPKIILMGQDLCYTENKAYASGSWDEKKPSKQLNFEEMVRVKNIAQEEVYTDRVFLGMKLAFERTCKRHPHLTFINASEGGIAIDGIENMTLRRVLDEELKGYDSSGIDINQVLSQYEAEEQDDTDEVVLAIAEDLRQIAAITDSCLRDLRAISGEDIVQDTCSKILGAVSAQLDQIKHMDFYQEVLYWYIEDQINALQNKYTSHDSDPSAKRKALFERLIREAIVIGDFGAFTKRLVEEYLGQRKLTIIYEQ